MNRQTRVLHIQNVHLLCAKPFPRHNPHYWHVSEEAAVINYQEFMSYQDLQWLLSSLHQEQRLGTHRLKKKNNQILWSQSILQRFCRNTVPPLDRSLIVLLP